MTNRCWIQTIALPVTLFALATNAQGQGKGKGQGQGKAEHKQEQVARKAEKQNSASAAKHGNEMAHQPRNAGQIRADENHVAHAASRHDDFKDNSAKKILRAENAPPRAIIASGNRGRNINRFVRDLHQSEVRPVVQRFVISNRPAEYLIGGATSYAFARGIPENTLVIMPSGRDVWIRNKKGDQLIAIDDDRARDLGVWEVSPLAEPVREGSPSFCRSGEGHPVWGRQWCLQKGFGLGTSSDIEWAAARDMGDLSFVRPITTTTLTRDALLSVLGQVAFDRLALHALTLGYTDPLSGLWRTEATGPNVLLVNSGRFPVAEVVDGNRDQRPDLMLVALRPW
jgi:hypothetical protein